MCMSLVLSGRGISIAATDTRWSSSITIGGREDSWHNDDGLKIRRVPGGWACATGDGRLCALALRKLEQSGCDGVQAAFNEALVETLAHPAMAGRTEVQLTHFLIVSDTGAIEVSSNEDGASGRVVPREGAYEMRASWPPGMSPDAEQEVQSAFAECLGRQGRLAGVVHAVATAFIEARRYDDQSMSSEVEVGLSVWGGSFGYLRGEAVDIAASCLRRNGTADVEFGPPPVLPPFPMLECEQRLFTPYEGVAS